MKIGFTILIRFAKYEAEQRDKSTDVKPSQICLSLILMHHGHVPLPTSFLRIAQDFQQPWSKIGSVPTEMPLTLIG